MTIEFVLSRYGFYSTKASDILRQLGFAGIALVWVFRGGAANSTHIPDDLRDVAVMIVIALALDLLQYVVGSGVWGGYHWWKEERVMAAEKFEAPRWLNWPALTFYVLKIVAMATAYLHLLAAIAGRTT